MFDCAAPLRQFRRLLLLARAPLVKRVAQIVFGPGLQFRIGSRQRLAESVQRLVVVARLVSRRAEIVMRRCGVAPPRKLLLKGFARLPVSLLTVKLHARIARRCRQRERQKNDCNRRGGTARYFPRRSSRRAAAFIHEQRRGEQCHAETERPPVALDRMPGQLCVDFVFVHFFQSFVHDFPHVGGTVFKVNINPAADFGELSQPVLVETRFDELAVFIFHKARPSRFRRQRNQRAVVCPDAHRENADALRAVARRGDTVGVDLLAIAENDQRPVVALAFSKRIHRDLDRVRDVRAPHRDDTRIKLADRVQHRAGIRRERRLQKRIAGEGDHPHAVALQQPGKILRGEFRAGEPVWCDVGGEHAFGNVDGEQDVPALAFFLLPGEAVARTGERGDDARERGELE